MSTKPSDIVIVEIPLTRKAFLLGEEFEVDGNIYKVTDTVGTNSMVLQKYRDGDWRKQCVYNSYHNTLYTSIINQKVKAKPIFKK